MNYLYQLGIILFITFIAEALNFYIDLPIPASIYGLFIMTILLVTKIIKIEQIRDTAKYLLQIMQIMFIPGAVGLVVSFSSLREFIIPFLFITISSTIVVMIVTGKTCDFILFRKGEK